MAIYSFKEHGSKEKPALIPKRVMHRIIQNKDKEIHRHKEMLAENEELIDDLQSHIKYLREQRQKYLVLSLCSAIFGIIMFVVGVI